MLQVADWVLHSHSIEPVEFHSAHKAVMKKILSHSQEMDAGDIIEYDKKDDEYYETSAYEDFLQATFIQPYDTETFWEELADALAQRDILREIGEEKLQAMDPFERMCLLSNKAETYENEFEEHGLEYFKLQRDNLATN